MGNYIYRRRGGLLFFFAVLAVFAFTVLLFLGVFFWYGRTDVRVSLEREYYLLVRDCEDATASAVAGQVYLAGGAGYLLGEGNAVVLSGYFRVEDAERVQSSMAEKGVETRILTVKTRDFTLKGEDAAQERAVVSNAVTVETCARILYDAANGLERSSLSQEEGRAAVKGVVKSLKGLRIGNEGGLYDEWNAFLMAAERRGTEIAEGIVFAKDLRYLQVELLLAVAGADGYFA